MESADEILFQQKGCAGIITLNKPETLNAVTDAMLTALNGQLDLWENNDTITRVIIKAVPGRAFSAGGDIRHLYECGIAGDYDFDFFAREYILNARIARFPKPYIALVDGIAMGGGVGVSFHGSHRIAGEGLNFAMPEVGIGFFPDVGASYFLSRLPGHLGLYLGLTGRRVKQADAVWSGLATHAVKSGDLSGLEDALCADGSVDDHLAGFSFRPEEGPLQQEMNAINRFFSLKSVDAILDGLADAAECSRDDASVWAASTLATMRQKSPTSLAIAFRQINAGRSLTIEECMEMEFRILKRILPQKDFYEGIRAAIIDKDNAPVWQATSGSPQSVTQTDAYFAPLGSEELNLP